MPLATEDFSDLPQTDVICPMCALNFPATPQAALDRIAELEAALREMVYFDESSATWHCAIREDYNVHDIVSHVLTVNK